MCLAVLQTVAQKDGLTRKEFSRAFEANADGFGLAYIDKAKGFRVEKPYWSFRRSWKAYRRAMVSAKPKTPILLHFRFATSGCCNEENTHPHLVPLADLGRFACMAHNGVLDGGDRERSDTCQFVDTVLWGRSLEQLWSDSFEERIRPWIVGSRIVLLDDKGKWKVFNEGLGEWRGSTWFSNTCAFRVEQKVKVYGYRSVYESGWEGSDHAANSSHGSAWDTEPVPAPLTPRLGYSTPEEDEEDDVDPETEHERAFDWWYRNCGKDAE